MNYPAQIGSLPGAKTPYLEGVLSSCTLTNHSKDYTELFEAMLVYSWRKFKTRFVVVF